MYLSKINDDGRAVSFLIWLYSPEAKTGFGTRIAQP